MPSACPSPFLEIVGSAQTGIEFEPHFLLDVRLQAVGISVVGRRFRGTDKDRDKGQRDELLHVHLDNLMLQYAVAHEERGAFWDVRVLLQDIQVDNQDVDALFPVVLSRVPPEDGEEGEDTPDIARLRYKAPLSLSK